VRQPVDDGDRDEHRALAARQRRQRDQRAEAREGEPGTPASRWRRDQQPQGGDEEQDEELYIEALKKLFDLEEK
jgi:hypothetical protein